MLEIIDEAKEDVIGSLAWYMERSLKAAEGFQKALRQAYAAILDAPELGGSFDRHTRWYQLKKYPFLVIYQIEPSCIRVIAVAHKRRRTGFWKSRL